MLVNRSLQLLLNLPLGVVLRVLKLVPEMNVPRSDQQ